MKTIGLVHTEDLVEGEECCMTDYLVVIELVHMIQALALVN